MDNKKLPNVVNLEIDELISSFAFHPIISGGMRDPLSIVVILNELVSLSIE